ncbi:MAG: N-acetylmuramoyl-L-alanine amidase [Chloroflexi bacterium]|nr:N-acetylmuramoyl-L-alanine amidase [Chloroflexota bacterium]
MKILLDPGHGGRDPGAVGLALSDSTADTKPLERLREKDVTLAVAQRAATALREHGYTVLLTRETDVDVPLYARTGMALSEQVDAFISIHANAGGGTGCEVWYQEGDDSSRALAAALEKGMCEMNLVPNRGLKVGSSATRTNWYTFSQLSNDVLLELAFLDHESDALQLQQHPDRFAQGIVKAIRAHFPLDTNAHTQCAVEKQQLIAQRDAMLQQMYGELMSDRTDLAYAIRIANGARLPDDLGGMARDDRLRELNEKWAGKI